METEGWLKHADGNRLKSSDERGLIRVGHSGCESKDKASAGFNPGAVNFYDNRSVSMFHEIPEPPGEKGKKPDTEELSVGDLRTRRSRDPLF